MNKRIKKKKGFYDCPKCGRVMRYGLVISNPPSQPLRFHCSKERKCNYIHKGERFTLADKVKVKVFSDATAVINGGLELNELYI